MKTYPLLRIISFLGWAMLLSPSSVIAENTIQISEDHFNNLGVILGKLEPAKQIPILTAPAKVAIPPAHEYIVSASQAGLITKLYASTGDKVKKGEVLAQLDSPELLSMQLLYLKADSDMQLGSLSYQRDKKLLEDGVIAGRRWQETRSQYNAFVSVVSEHKQLLEIAGMTNREIDHLRKTRQLSALLNVRAPISGIVMEQMTVAGKRVDMLTPLYRLADLNNLRLDIDVPQERIDSIKVGDQVQIENTPVKGEITLIGQSVNPANKTVLARAAIKVNQAEIRAGQTISVQIIKPSRNSAFKVPNTAIAQNEGKSFIFVRTQGEFKVIPVTVLGKQDDKSFISGDLTGNEDIAVKGAAALKANWLGLGGAE